MHRYSFIFLGNTSFSGLAQREHALAYALARKGYHVTYVEGMPSLASTIRSAWRKLFSKESIDERVGPEISSVENLTIRIPPMVPTFFRSSWIPRYDAWIFRRWFAKAFKGQDWDSTIVMVMFPYWWFGFIDRKNCPAKKIIYDICDALEMPSRTPGTLLRMKTAEQALMKDADTICFSAHEMAELFSTQHGSAISHFLPNAVAEWFIHTSAAPRKGGSVIGYVGALDKRWADRELLIKIATAFPQCSLIVRSSAEKAFVRRLAAFKNVTILGYQDYRTLPNLISRFDVGIIPFLQNRITRVINPLKLYEYSALGIHVVATKTAELEHYADLIALADTHDEFLERVEQALQEKGDAKRKDRVDFAARNTWELRSEELLKIIEQG